MSSIALLSRVCLEFLWVPFNITFYLPIIVGVRLSELRCVRVRVRVV